MSSSSKYERYADYSDPSPVLLIQYVLWLCCFPAVATVCWLMIYSVIENMHPAPCSDLYRVPPGHFLIACGGTYATIFVYLFFFSSLYRSDSLFRSSIFVFFCFAESLLSYTDKTAGPPQSKKTHTHKTKINRLINQIK